MDLDRGRRWRNFSNYENEIKMNAALKKVNAIAKKIRRAHPGWSFKTVQKEAGKKYRASHKKKAVGRVAAKRKPAKRKIIRRRISGTMFRPQTDVNLGAGAGETIGSIKSRAKKVLRHELANSLLRRELATKKLDKRKATKKIQAIKRQIKNFS